MRLLNVGTLELEVFTGHTLPRYAILSHTWGEDEFHYDHLLAGLHKDLSSILKDLSSPKRGLQKVLNMCRQAERDNLDYVWIDTCCIDKSNGAELSEAINSMFKWYQNSAACYAYLEDVTLEMDGTITNFENSRWFSRGWTLQELIAPHGLRFFDSKWKPIQTRNKLHKRIAEITGIKEHYLAREHSDEPAPYIKGQDRSDNTCVACGHVDNTWELLMNEPIAVKMKWAADRETTRVEDRAYCLMGLFDVSMPPLYGEGSKAFVRFQEEILRHRPDQSILAWTLPESHELDPHRRFPCLIDQPSGFELDLFEKDDSRLGRGNISVSSRGMEIDVLVIPCPVIQYVQGGTKRRFQNLSLGVLSCALGNDSLSRIAIILQPLRETAQIPVFSRAFSNILVMLTPEGKPEVMNNLREEQANMTIECNLESVKSKRVLLPAIPSSVELNHDIPIVKVVLDGFGDWHIQAQYPEFSEGDILDRKFEVTDEALDHTAVGRGIFCITDNNSCFVAILAADNVNKAYSKPKTSYMCWIETWQSFTENVGDALSDPTPEALKAALSQYIKNFSKNKFTRPPSEVTEGDYRAKGRVKSTNFLGRSMHTLEVEIQSAMKGASKAAAATKPLIKPSATMRSTSSDERKAKKAAAGGARWYQISKKIEGYAEDASHQFS